MKHFTLKECAALLSCSYSWLWRCVKRGDIEVVRLGDSIRISESALAAFLEVQKSKRG